MKMPATTTPRRIPPLKRLRAGRKLCRTLTEAINSPANPRDKHHPFGRALMNMRKEAGITNRYQFAELLHITDQTLQKLENQPLKSGSAPLIKLLNTFGLALTLEVPELDTTMGHPDLAHAFFALRCRAADMTQRQLGEKSGVARTTIQNFESGKPVKLSVLLKLADAMNAKVLVVQSSQIQASVEHDTLNVDQANDPDIEAEQENVDTRPLNIDRYAPSLSEILRMKEPRDQVDPTKAERIRRANVKRAPWYWDEQGRRRVARSA